MLILKTELFSYPCSTVRPVFELEDKLMGRRILRHTYRSRALAFVVNVARGEKSEEDVPLQHALHHLAVGQRQDTGRGTYALSIDERTNKNHGEPFGVHHVFTVFSLREPGRCAESRFWKRWRCCARPGRGFAAPRRFPGGVERDGKDGEERSEDWRTIGTDFVAEACRSMESG